MNINTTDIKIGHGLGDITFGDTKEKIKHLLGEPSEIDTFNASGEEEGYLTEAWHYDDREFSLSFDEEDNWRLTTISVSSNESKYNADNLIGKSMEEVMKIMDTNDLGENEMDDLSDEGVDQKLVSFLRASLNLWFEDGDLSEIQWGVLWSNEDTPSWPEN
jgi:hypothetical protein